MLSTTLPSVGALLAKWNIESPPDVPAFVRLARPILMDRSEDAELLARIFRIHPFPVEHQFGAQPLRVAVTHRHALDRGVVDAQRVVEEGVRVVAAQFVAREDTHVGPGAVRRGRRTTPEAAPPRSSRGCRRSPSASGLRNAAYCGPASCSLRPSTGRPERSSATRCTNCP